MASPRQVRARTAAAVIALTLAIGACNSTTPAAPVAEYSPDRDPVADVASAVTRAKQEHRRVLVVVGGEWCKWCHILAAYIKANPGVERAWNDRFVTVHVNYSPENENKLFLGGYPQIPGYPHIFVLESDGSLLHSQNTGLLEEGQGYSTAKVMAFLDEWKKP